MPADDPYPTIEQLRAVGDTIKGALEFVDNQFVAIRLRSDWDKLKRLEYRYVKGKFKEGKLSKRMLDKLLHHWEYLKTYLPV